MRILSTKKHRWEMLALIVAIPLIIWSCSFVINTLYLEQEDPETGEQVLYVKAGEDVTFKFDGTISIDGDASNEMFIVAFLVPTSWNVAENATVTYTESKYDPGMEMGMTHVALCGNKGTWDEMLKAQYGVMSNVLNDMEWVAFQSNKVYPTVNGNIDFTVTFKCNSGVNNLRFKPAFFINHSTDNLGTDAQHFAVAEGDCFEVLEGEGATIDYCSFHYYAITPLEALQDDYITFTFQGDVNSENELDGCDEVYFKAAAYTTDGMRHEADKMLMTRQSEGSDRFEATIWPTEFFGIAEGETVSYIEYSFTNADETLTVTQSDDERDNGGEEPEEEKTPFTFELRCN